MIVESFADQLAKLKPYLEQAERDGSGVQVTLSCNPGAQISEPRVAVFPKLTSVVKRP